MHISLSSPTMAAFPDFWAGRLPHCVFRGLLSVHSRYGLHTRQVTYMTLYTGGFSRFVTSAAAPIATGWSDLAVRDSHPLRNRAFARRTKNCTLAFMAAVRTRVLPANLPKTGLYRRFNCREQATVPSGTLPSALSSKSRDDFGGYFRFSLKQEMRARNDLDLRARLYLFHLFESI